MSLRSCCRLLGPLFLFVLLSSPAAGQSRRDDTYFITGTVVGESGQPIKHARIVLSTPSHGREEMLFSNDEGHFAFERLPEGHYRLQVSASSYRTHEEDVMLFSVSRHLRIVMHPVSDKTSEAPGLATVVSVSALAVPAPARDEYRKAQIAQKENDFKTAHKHVEEALRHHPKYAEAYALKGFLLLHEQKLDDAQAAFQTALEIDPQLGDALLGLGRVYNNRSRFVEAEQELLKALSADSSTWQVNYELGRACLGLKKNQEAEKYLRQARAASPSYAPVYYLLAQVLLLQDRPLEAIPEMEAYLKYAPTGPTADKVRDLIRRINEWKTSGE